MGGPGGRLRWQRRQRQRNTETRRSRRPAVGGRRRRRRPTRQEEAGLRTRHWVISKLVWEGQPGPTSSQPLSHEQVTLIGSIRFCYSTHSISLHGLHCHERPPPKRLLLLLLLRLHSSPPPPRGLLLLLCSQPLPRRLLQLQPASGLPAAHSTALAMPPAAAVAQAQQ